MIIVLMEVEQTWWKRSALADCTSGVASDIFRRQTSALKVPLYVPIFRHATSSLLINRRYMHAFNNTSVASSFYMLDAIHT
jgi:hypothetical protein